MKINNARGLMLLMSFVALFVSLAFDNQILSLLLMAACLLVAALVLYFNLGKLTDISDDNPKKYTLKMTTIFDVIILCVCVLTALLIGTGVIEISENGEKFFAACIVSFVIMVIGNIAPKLPFSKHTGLRLPWTVSDEETWIVAHRILGYISIPLSILYVAGIPAITNFEILTLITIVLWVGIPGGFSYVFFRKKTSGKI